MWSIADKNVYKIYATQQKGILYYLLFVQIHNNNNLPLPLFQVKL